MGSATIDMGGQTVVMYSTIVGNLRFDNMYQAIGAITLLVAGVLIALVGIFAIFAVIEGKDREYKARKRNEARSRGRSKNNPGGKEWEIPADYDSDKPVRTLKDFGYEDRWRMRRDKD